MVSIILAHSNTKVYLRYKFIKNKYNIFIKRSTETSRYKKITQVSHTHKNTPTVSFNGNVENTTRYSNTYMPTH